MYHSTGRTANVVNGPLLASSQTRPAYSGSVSRKIESRASSSASGLLLVSSGGCSGLGRSPGAMRIV